MKVFVTGASGWIGSVTVPELIKHGHTVVGLARSDASADAIAAMGAEILRGDITTLDVLKQGATSCDGVIHLAFVHDFSDYMGSCAKDLAAIEAMGSVLEGTGKPLVITSGTMMAPLNVLATEEMQARLDPHSPRSKNEVAALALADKGVRVSSVRLPPTVHGAGDHAFIPAIIGQAKATGFAGYVGEGSNIWPGVHRLDAAVLFRLAVEKAPAGTILHAVENEGYPFKKIAEAIGKRHGLKVESVSAEDVPKVFTWLAPFVVNNNPTSSKLTRERFGWDTKEIGLLEDIEQNY